MGFWKTILAFGAIIVVSVSTAEASLLRDVRGLMRDPFKVDAGTKNLIELVERLNAYLIPLQNKLDASVKGHIDSVNKVLDDAIGMVDKSVEARLEQTSKIIEQTFKSVLVLETQIIVDTKNLVACSAALMQRSVQETLADAINQLAGAAPGIDILGLRVWTFSVSAGDIKDPITEYRLLLSKYFTMINDLKPSDDANRIPSAYAEMQRLTLRTKCHYENTTAEPELVREFARLRALAAPWDGLTSFVTRNSGLVIK